MEQNNPSPGTNREKKRYGSQKNPNVLCEMVFMIGHFGGSAFSLFVPGEGLFCSIGINSYSYGWFLGFCSLLPLRLAGLERRKSTRLRFRPLGLSGFLATGAIWKIVNLRKIGQVFQAWWKNQPKIRIFRWARSRIQAGSKNPACYFWLAPPFAPDLLVEYLLQTTHRILGQPAPGQLETSILERFRHTYFDLISGFNRQYFLTFWETERHYSCRQAWHHIVLVFFHISQFLPISRIFWLRSLTTKEFQLFFLDIVRHFPDLFQAARI